MNLIFTHLAAVVAGAITLVFVLRRNPSLTAKLVAGADKVDELIDRLAAKLKR